MCPAACTSISLTDTTFTSVGKPCCVCVVLAVLWYLRNWCLKQWPVLSACSCEHSHQLVVDSCVQAGGEQSATWLISAWSLIISVPNVLSAKSSLRVFWLLLLFVFPCCFISIWNVDIVLQNRSALFFIPLHVVVMWNIPVLFKHRENSWALRSSNRASQWDHSCFIFKVH